MKVLYPVNVEDGNWSLLIGGSELKEVKGRAKGEHSQGGKNLREGILKLIYLYYNLHIHVYMYLYGQICILTHSETQLNQLGSLV